MSFIYSIPVIVWLIASGILFAFGEFLSKKFALAPSFPYLLLVMCTYALSSLLWLPAILQKNQLSIVGVIWSVLSLAATILIGLIVFGEKLSFAGVAGIVFAVIAVILLSIA